MNHFDIKYSVIIPVYNSRDLIGEVVTRVLDFFQNKEMSCEVILINDGSQDNSWEIIREIATRCGNVRAINLLRNYGQHSAVYCGIKEARGEYLITMDDDMQNPPDEIEKLISKVDEGYDVVFAKFRKKRHGLIRSMGSKIIGYLNYKIFNKPRGLVLSNFRILKHDVAERLRNYRAFDPYIPGLLLMFSSQVANVETEHHPRKSGKSNYSTWIIVKLVGRLLFNYSSFPLKALTYLGFMVSLLSFIAGVGYIFKSVFVGVSVPGWTTLVVLLSFLCGFIIIMLGVLGEYMARIMGRISVGEAYHIREVAG